MPVNQLESWISLQINLPRKTVLSRSALSAWQKKQLINTLNAARKNSPWYSKHLNGLTLDADKGIDKLLKDLPFTTAEDLREYGQEMLSCSQADIQRIITLYSSGTSAKPKRIYFTAADLEKTKGFFQHGMRFLISDQDRVLVLLPSQKENDVGSLLVQALEDAGHRAKAIWPAHDSAEVAFKAKSFQAGCLVGLPQHILTLAREPELARKVAPFVKSVLLCSDYAAPCVRKAISENLDCSVHIHYGSSESGLGGAVECSYGQGCHIRESDLLFEVIDPEKGRQLPEGTEGELVFTTLNRQGMPLIRYRTGDKGSLTSKRCACGSILARLQNLGGRMESSVNLPGAGILTIADLDEILLKIPEITAYEAWIEQGEQELFAPKKTEVLRIDLYTLENSASKVKDTAFKAVQTNPDIKQALTTSSLQIRFDFCKENPNKSHTIKRKLIDKR